MRKTLILALVICFMTAFGAQAAQITAQAVHALAYVALYKALGGAPVAALQGHGEPS